MDYEDMKDRMCQELRRLLQIPVASPGLSIELLLWAPEWHIRISAPFAIDLIRFTQFFFVELTIFIPDFAPGGDTKRG
jgi:hypothetical protein